MIKIAEAKLPCLSIMNMPPLPYLKRIPALAKMELEEAYTNAAVWERFEPGLVSLCSPDPQAFRPPEEAANVLHVGLPTNFKAASFADEKHNLLLRELEADIDAVKLDGQDVPVKLKVFDSMFVPLAKWSMLLTGNYRCITPQEPQSIRDAVHGDINLSQSIYDHVDAIAQRLGADPTDQVPFEKYAKAAESLLKPSSAARAVAGGAPFIERVDLLVKLISHQLGVPNAEIDRTVQIVNQKLNESIASGRIGRAATRSIRRDVEPCGPDPISIWRFVLHARASWKHNPQLCGVAKRMLSRLSLRQLRRLTGARNLPALPDGPPSKIRPCSCCACRASFR